MMDRTVRSDNRGIGGIGGRRQVSRLVTLSLCCFLILLVNGIFLANTTAVTARSWYTDTRFAVTPDRRIARERLVPSISDYSPYGRGYRPSEVPSGPGSSGGSGYSPDPYEPGSGDRDTDSADSSSHATSRSTNSGDSSRSSDSSSYSYRRFGR